MAWKLAPSLEQLRTQVDAHLPHRSRASDGDIGDARHRAEYSDHNPNRAGVVCAWDCTATPRDSWAQPLADTIASDPRCAYVIFNRHIRNHGGAWHVYTGTDPHTNHIHVSVSQSPALYNSVKPWALSFGAKVTPASAMPTIVRGTSDHASVRTLQLLLNAKRAASPLRVRLTWPRVATDGVFNRTVERAVIRFQKRCKGIAPNGVVGASTWKALGR